MNDEGLKILPSSQQCDFSNKHFKNILPCMGEIYYNI